MFADQRQLLGILTFWNVASNLPFLVVGLTGLLILLRQRAPGVLHSLVPSYVAFFLAAALGASLIVLAATRRAIQHANAPVSRPSS